MATHVAPSVHTATRSRQRVVLQSVWLFALLNYLYCDVVSLMHRETLTQYLTGRVGDLRITEGFLLGAAVLMEIPIAMVLVSRVAPYRVARTANIVAGAVMTLVQAASLFVGTGPASYYLFFSVLELSATAFVVWYAWRWDRP
jgi:MFS family permease